MYNKYQRIKSEWNEGVKSQNVYVKMGWMCWLTILAEKKDVSISLALDQGDWKCGSAMNSERKQKTDLSGTYEFTIWFKVFEFQQGITLKLAFPLGKIDLEYSRKAKADIYTWMYSAGVHKTKSTVDTKFGISTKIFVSWIWWDIFSRGN